MPLVEQSPCLDFMGYFDMESSSPAKGWKAVAGWHTEVLAPLGKQLRTLCVALSAEVDVNEYFEDFSTLHISTVVLGLLLSLDDDF